MNSPKTTYCKHRHRQQPHIRRSRRPSLDLILFVPFLPAYLLVTAALRRFLFVCFLLHQTWFEGGGGVVGGGVSTCWSYYSVRNILATPMHTNDNAKATTQQQMSYLKCVVVAVIYVIFQNFCLFCVSALPTHSRISKEQQKTAALASASVYTGWSGLVSYSSSLATLLLFAFVCYVLCGPQLSFTVFAMRSCFLWVASAAVAAAVGGVMPSDFVIVALFFGNQWKLK